MIDSKIVVEGSEDPNSKISHLRRGGSKLHLTRTGQRAFHPHGDQRVLMISPDIFTVLRTSPEGDQHVLTMANVTSRTCSMEIPLSELIVEETRWYDLINKKEWKTEKKKLSITLQPYDVIWLKPVSELKETDHK